MSEEQSQVTSSATSAKDAKQMVTITYILYLVGLVIGVTSIVGLVIAYIYRGNSSPWISEHYRYLIRTFWISLLYGFISAILFVVVIGYLLLLLTAIWIIIRCVKGLQALQRNEAPANVGSWLF